MVTFKTNNYSQTFYKILLLAFMLACMSGSLSAQTTFSGPEIFASYNGSHTGNSGAISIDIDGDGDLDIVHSNRDFDLTNGGLDAIVHIRINDGLGDFTQELKLILPFTFAPDDFDVGDLNNDGLPDVVATGGGFDGNPGFVVFLNTTSGGTLSFGSSTSYSPAENAGISIADINADGNNDLIVTRQNLPAAEIGVLYGDGSGVNWTIDYTIDASNSSIQYTIIEDFDGDGIQDIMGLRPHSFDMYYFKGEALPGGGPSGTFLSDVTVDSGRPMYVAKSEDLNEDGAKDIVLTSSAGVTILINNNDGTGINFTESEISISSDRLGLDVSDIDGDNHLDLILANAGLDDVNAINLLLGNGDGTFQSTTNHPYLYLDFSEAKASAGDYNGDGLNDMAAINYGVHVFLNSSKSDLEIDQAGTNVSSGSTYDFGYVSIGSGSGATTFTVSNVGTIAALLNGSPKVQVTGPQSSMFTIDESSTSASISPAGSTTFDVTFTPSLPDEGINTATLSIPSNDPLSPFTITLTGTTQLTPDNVLISASPVCSGQDVTLTQSNGILGPGEQWVWYSGTCGGTQEGVGESIVVNPTVTTDYFVRAETLTGDALTSCAAGQVVVSGDVVTVSVPTNLFETMEGESQVMTVVSTGSNPIYQWRKNGVDIIDGGRISGTQTDVLTILNLEEDDEAIYTCVVSNYCSSEESANIHLTVLQLPPNGDCGTVLDFDGNQERVEFGNVLNHTGSLTLEAWVNFDNLSGNFYGHPVIAKPHQVGTDVGSVYQLHVRNGGSVEVELGNRANAQFAAVSTQKKLQTNRWYHIAATVDKQPGLFPLIKIYIDGVLETSTYRGFTAITSSYPLMVGGFEAGNASRDRYSNAKIDEPRIWSKARTQAEIKSTMTTKLNGDEPNLMGYWDFDEGAHSGIVVDKASAGNNGSLISMDPATDWLTTDGSIDDDNSYISPIACTSYTSPSGNFTWTTSGVYKDTVQTTQGCDSIVTVNLTIGKIDQLITFNPLPDVSYGDSDFALSATSDSGLPISYTSADPTVVSISGSTLSVVGVGTVNITASQAGDMCHNPALDIVQSLTVNKASLTATVDDQSKFYGEANPALTFSYSGFVNGEDESVIDVVPSAMTTADETSGVGDYNIVGSGGSDGSYDFSYLDGTLSINKKGIAAVIEDQTQDYGGLGILGGFTFPFGGFVNGEDSSVLDALPIQVTSVNSTSPVGSYPINSTYDPNVDDNYDVFIVGIGTYTVNPASLTITADDQSRPLNNPNPTLTVSYSGFVNGEDESVLDVIPSISTTATISSPSGDYPIELSGGSDDNYDFTLVDGTLTIDAAVPITITADTQSKVYGDSDPIFTYQITNGSLAPGDVITGSLSRVAGEDVGNYAITIGSLSAGSGYAITLASQDLTIAPKPMTVTANAGQGKLYGQLDPEFFYSVTSGSLETGDALSGTLERVLGENVGLYPLQQGTLTAGSNYSITYVPDDFLILAKPITVTADASQTKVYGTPDPVFSYAVTSGFLESGDSFLGALDRNTGEDVGNYAIGLGSLDAGSNYNLTFVSDDFAITPKQITVTPHNWSKVYGDTEPIITFDAIPPLESGDSFSGFLERDQGEDVDLYAIDLGSLTAGGNYTLTLTPSNFSILERNLTITPNPGQTKTYGDPDPVFSYSVLGLLAGDQISGSLERAQGENVGNYTLDEGTLDAGANYIITVIPDDFVIIPKPITVTADVGQSKTYGEADPGFTYSLTSGFLEVGDVFVGMLSRVSGEDAGDYGIIQGSLSAGNNYTISFQSNDFSITPKTLIIVPDDQAKTYGDSDPAFTYSILGGLVGGDMLNGNLERQAGEDVGIYAISSGTLDGGSNYLLAVDPANLSINPATLRATADDQTRVYNQPNPPMTVSYTGFVNGDTKTDINEAIATTSATIASDAGNYAIVSSGGSAANYSFIHEPGLLTITKANQMISFDVLNDVSVGGTDFTLTGSASSGLSVSYTSSDPSVATVSGNTVSIVGVGTTNITASQIGDINYNAASDVIQQLVVNSKLQQTITFGPLANAVYGESFNLNATGGGSSNPVTFVSSDLSVATISGNTVTILKVGTTNITASQMGDGTYNPAQDVTQTLIVDQRMITVTADETTKVYGEADPQLTYQITQGDLVPGDFIVGNLTRVTGEDAGTYAIQNSTLNAGSNYLLTYIPNNLTIQARPVHVEAIEVSKVYGETDPVLTYQITAGTLIGSDAFSGALERSSGEDAGRYQVLQGSLVLDSNYDLGFTGNDLVIEKAVITVSVEDGNRVYNTPNPTFNLSYGGFIGGDVEADLDVLPTASTTADVISNTGTYPITASGGADNNYDFQYIVGVLTITKATATIILSDLEQEENGMAKEPTITTDPTGLNSILTWADGSAPTIAGRYDFKVSIDETNYEGEEEGTLILLKVLGFDEVPILIYPNPADEYLLVESQQKVMVEIMDLRGNRLIKSTSNEPIDIQGIPSGTFLIRLTNENNETRTTRFIRKAN